MIVKTTSASGNVELGCVIIINQDNYQVNSMRKRDDGLYEWNDEDPKTVAETDVIQTWNTRNPIETDLFEAVEGNTKAWKLVGEL
jgi:hypothetical protein